MAEGVNLFDLAARVTADTSQHDRALTASQQKILALAAEHKALDAKSVPALKNVGNAAQQLSSHLTNTSGAGHTLAQAFRALSATAVVTEGPLGGVAGRLRAIGTEATQLGGAMGGVAGPIGLAVLAAAALTVGLALLAKGFFDLISSTAEFQGKMFDLSQQTGVSVETLSALEIAAKTTGSDIGQITASLGIFQKKLEEAEDPTSQMAIKLKALGIETNNTEEAFRQSLAVLAKMPENYHQTALALELFGRGGKSLLAILKETKGDLDGTIRKFRELGVLISTENAKAADEFNDQLELIGFQIREMGGAVAKDAIPQMREALQGLSKTLKDNQEAFNFLGRVISTGIVPIFKVLDEALTVTTFTLGALHIGLNPLEAVFGNITTRAFAAANAILSIRDAVSGAIGAGKPLEESISIGAQLGAGIAPGKAPGLFREAVRPTGGGGGGGGGDPMVAVRKLADLRLKAVVDELKFEEEQNRRSLDRQWIDFNQYAGRYNATEERRHKAVVEGLAAEMTAAERVRKPREREIAIQEIANKQAQEEITHKKNGNKVLDERANLLDQLNAFLAQQTREINYARAGTDQYDKAVAELEVVLTKAGVTEIGYALDIARTNAATQRAIDLVKQLTRERRAIAERPRFAADKNFAQSIGIELDTTDATRRRRVTALSDDMLAKLRELSGNITNVLSNSIRDGFDLGVKEGFRSMLLGFARMLEQMALQWLASNIFKMLSNALTPQGGQASGGGGFLGFFRKWLLPLLGAAAGGLGGGSTVRSGGVQTGIPFIGTLFKPRGYATGLEFVPFDNFPALLHRGERVVPAAQNRGASGNVIINVYAKDAQSFMSRDTQRQVADKVRRLQLHAALTG